MDLICFQKSSRLMLKNLVISVMPGMACCNTLQTKETCPDSELYHADKEKKDYLYGHKFLQNKYRSQKLKSVWTCFPSLGRRGLRGGSPLFIKNLEKPLLILPKCNKHLQPRRSRASNGLLISSFAPLSFNFSADRKPQSTPTGNIPASIEVFMSVSVSPR